MDDFTLELQALLNKYNKDTVTKTPGFILARYTEACLKTLEFTAKMRDNWYGKRNVFSGKLVETSDLDVINYAIAEMVKVADRVPLAAYACVAFCDALDGLKALRDRLVQQHADSDISDITKEEVDKIARVLYHIIHDAARK